MARIKGYRISLLIVCSMVIGTMTLIGCGWLGLTEPTDGIFIEVSGDNNDIHIDEDLIDGDGDILNDEGGCCDDEEEEDYSRCWSTCWSKNELDPEECAACERGERDCVWPWEIDRECLQE